MLSLSRLWACRKFCPSKSRTLFLDDQSDEVQDESQKDIVFIGNASSDSENDLEHEKVLSTIRYVAIVRCTLAQPKDMVD